MSKIDDYIAQRRANSAEFAEQFEKESAKLDIGVSVRDLRQRLGLSQRDFAEKVGKPQSTIARIENGNMNPSTKMLEQIAQASNQRLLIKFIPMS